MASPDILEAFGRIGRTEDLAFSPDGTRLALAGFGLEFVYLLDGVTVQESGLWATGFTKLTSRQWAKPHGVTFLSDTHLAVSNRAGRVTILHLPTPCTGVAEIEAEIVYMSGRSGPSLRGPGSIRTVWRQGTFAEFLTCYNASNLITRQVCDLEHLDVTPPDPLIRHSVNLPDGVAVSHDGSMFAVSSHESNEVLLFTNTADLTPDTAPMATLHGVTWPHGLVFSPDDNHLLVTDGGSPFVHVFDKDHGSWPRRATPNRAVQVMTDENYALGRYNRQEGGPKGIAIDSSGRFVCITCEHLPLGVLPARAFVDAGWTIDHSLHASKTSLHLHRNIVQLNRLGVLEAERDALRRRSKRWRRWASVVLDILRNPHPVRLSRQILRDRTKELSREQRR